MKFAMLISDASRRVDPLERFDGLLRQIEESLEIMKLCWAMEDFDFNGHHWQIEGATPHIGCVQEPHPPIWIGAH